ncbi:MAG: hypothetical protein SGCHY_001198 [Lobulomycetales sp.]
MIALLPNQLSATRLYANISFSELGQLLGCSEDAAELAASRMISEGRMKGSIDQLDRLVFFHDTSLIKGLDELIIGLCRDIDQVVSQMHA